MREVLWTPSFPCDSPIVRQEKLKTTTAARAKINSRTRWQKLQLILAANYADQDWFVSFTYEDEYLPRSKLEAKRRIKRFRADLREVCRARGFELRAVTCTEGDYDNVRLNHHMVIPSRGLRYEDVISLWPDGNVDFEPLEIWGYAYVAKYMTKESTDGKARVGEHSFSTTRNLRKPVIEPAQWVSGSVRLEPPPGSHVLLSERIDNEYGRYEYLEYLLPVPSKAEKVRPKKGSRRVDSDLDL